MLWQSAIGVKMGLPITRIEIGIRNGISAVDHPIIANVDAHMRNTGRVIGAFEEHKISRLYIGRGHGGADVA